MQNYKVCNFCKDADGVISSQLHTELHLGDNTFLRWKHIHCSWQKSMTYAWFALLKTQMFDLIKFLKKIFDTRELWQQPDIGAWNCNTFLRWWHAHCFWQKSMIYTWFALFKDTDVLSRDISLKKIFNTRELSFEDIWWGSLFKIDLWHK